MRILFDGAFRGVCGRPCRASAGGRYGAGSGLVLAIGGGVAGSVFGT